MHVWDLDADADPISLRAAWDQLADGERMRVEGTYRRKDGSTFPTEVHLCRLPFDCRRRFVAISRELARR